jgi:SPP1 family predicted phage head-tail adaptor
MNSGDLRHKIILQKLDQQADSYGERRETWSDFMTVWASIKPVSGREFFAAEAVNSEVSHKILIRYRPGVTASMRVKYKDRYFAVSAVLDFEERHEVLQLMCRELVGDEIQN